MLQTGSDASALNPLDEGRAEESGEERVLGKVLEVSAAARVPLQIDPVDRSQKLALRRGRE